MLNKKLRLFIKIITGNTRFFISRINAPLAVSFCITKKCQLNCSYCNIPSKSQEDLSLENILKKIDELKNLGCLRLSLTGGEPFLRNDIEKILKYAYKKGFFLTVNTNGILLRKYKKLWKYIDMVFLSVDGYTERQKKFRGGLKNIELFSIAKELRKSKISVIVNCLLSGQKKDEIDYLINNAEKYGFMIDFELFSPHEFSGDKPKSTINTELIDYIINKRKDSHIISNSQTNLEMMKKILISGKHPGNIRCFAGKTFAFIDNDGLYYPCFDIRGKIEGVKTFKELKKITDYCSFCRCNGSIEINSVYSIKIDSILNNLKWW